MTIHVASFPLVSSVDLLLTQGYTKSKKIYPYGFEQPEIVTFALLEDQSAISAIGRLFSVQKNVQ